MGNLFALLWRPSNGFLFPDSLLPSSQVLLLFLRTRFACIFYWLDILFSLLEKEFDTSLKKKRIYLDKAGEIIRQKKQELERSLRSVTYAKERLAEEESDKYMAYRMGNLSQKDYVEYKMCKENRLRDLEKQEKNFREQEVSLERDGETYLKAVRALIKLKNEQVLTRELIESLIDKIYVYPGKRVEVLFTYSDALVERQVKK